MPRAVLQRGRGRQDAGHQPRHAAPLGPRRPDQDDPRQRQPADRAGSRDRAAARRPETARSSARATGSPGRSAEVKVEGLMAQVELRRRRDPPGSSRSSRPTRSRSSGCEPGMAGDRGRQGDLGDGGARMRGLAAAIARRRRCSSRGGAASAALARRPDRLRGRVADRRLPEDRSGGEVLVRGLEHARRADPAGRAGGRLRLGEHDAAAAALHSDGPLLEAGRASRATRSSVIVPKSNPAKIHSVYDLRKPGIKLVIAAPERAGRRLHAAGAEEHEPDERALRTSSATRPTCARCWRRSRSARRDAGFVYSTDARTVPGKVTMIRIPAWAQPKVQYGICVVVGELEQGGCAARSSTGCSARRARRSCSGTASCHGSKPQARRLGARAQGRLRLPSSSARRAVALALPRAAGRRDLHARPAGRARPPALEPGRHRRARRQPQDDADRAGADPAVRDAARVPARHAAASRAGRCS